MNEKRTKIKKKMRDSLVTVIIPCYNQERTIGEAIESVLAQTFQDYEVIVVNDGSTDGSLSVIENYVRNYPNKVRYINQENQGVVSARNNAIAQSLVSGGGGVYIPARWRRQNCTRMPTKVI